MSDFSFLKNPTNNSWVISAPRRAKRPNSAKGTAAPTCPFCPGNEGSELYRVIGNKTPDLLSNHESSNVSIDSDWSVRVIPNKFPFAPIHELVIHSPDHHKSFDELPLEHVELILQTYRQRYQTHQEKGQVYIFHNHGAKAGESVPHPHTQIAVIPESMHLPIPRLEEHPQELHETNHFVIFAPLNAQWSDEVWIAPKSRGIFFGEVTDEELHDLAFVLPRLIYIFDLRHGREFPFNFYIYPGSDWYLRLIPREKTLGGFEVGTGIFVNTQDPAETIAFVKTHFSSPDEQMILQEHQATYHKAV